MLFSSEKEAAYKAFRCFLLYFDIPSQTQGSAESPNRPQQEIGNKEQAGEEREQEVGRIEQQDLQPMILAIDVAQKRGSRKEERKESLQAISQTVDKQKLPKERSKFAPQATRSIGPIVGYKA